MLLKETLDKTLRESARLEFGKQYIDTAKRTLDLALETGRLIHADVAPIHHLLLAAEIDFCLTPLPPSAASAVMSETLGRAPAQRNPLPCVWPYAAPKATWCRCRMVSRQSRSEILHYIKQNLIIFGGPLIGV